jgi:cell division protein FtsB
MKKFVFFIVVSLIIVFLGFRMVKDWNRYKILKSEVNELLNRQSLLSEEEKRLKTLKEEGSKIEILEKEAREILGLQKIGEKVVLVVSSQNSSLEASSTPETEGISHQFKILFDQVSHLWYNFYSWVKINIKK